MLDRLGKPTCRSFLKALQSIQDITLTPAIRLIQEQINIEIKKSQASNTVDKEANDKETESNLSSD
jgi:hypothetical protein